jgi:hypothetical protein
MSRPLRARLAALATMLVFVAAQPWVICPAMCLVDGHEQSHEGSAIAAAHHRSHVVPCHTGKVVPNEVTATGSLSIMLPAPWAPALPSLSVVTVPDAPPTAVFFHRIPAAEPPPPRSA